MWTSNQIAQDLTELGLPEGGGVLVHASMRSIGPIEGGAEGFIRALNSAIGDSGTIMAPTFTAQFRDPDEWQNPPETAEARERIRNQERVFDAAVTPADQPSMGIFAEVLRSTPGAQRSNHPTHSFCAVGSNAAVLTQTAPFHFPLGSESPLAILHRLDGWVLLVGVGHEVNASFCLAEVWADAPYVHRSARVKAGPNEYIVMRGCPGCTDGFVRAELVLRQGRITRRGYVGNAPCQLMRQQELVSMGIAMLQGDPESMLCVRPECRSCALARTFTAASTP